LAAELVRVKPDVLVTHGVPGALAAKRATDTIPIVMGVVGDAVAIGAVEGLARPGGNITGSSFFVPELNAKRLEVLKEALPRLSRVGVLLKRDNPVNATVLRAMEHTAQALKIQLRSVEARDPADLEDAVSALVKEHAAAIAVLEMANWTPTSFVGDIFRLTARFVPPPVATRAAVEWGSGERLRELFGDRVASLRLSEHCWRHRFESAEQWVDVFRRWYGPTVRAFAALDEARAEDYAAELVALVHRYNRATDGTVLAAYDYLNVIAVKRG